MAFTDTFTGTNGDFLKNRTGWAHASGSNDESCIIYSNALAADGTSVRNAFSCTDQSSVNQYISAKWLKDDNLHGNSFVACRLVDKDNWIGIAKLNNFSAGTRVVLCNAGTLTFPISGRGTDYGDDQWLKIEIDGDDVSLYSGGTSATPSWQQIGSTYTVSSGEKYTGFDTETAQGVVVGETDATVPWMDDFEAGALSGGPTTSTGALAAQSSSISGTASVTAPLTTTSGEIAAQSASISGTVLTEVMTTGAITPQLSEISGAMGVTGGVGTLTTGPWVNNTSTVWASETGITADIYSVTTGALLVRLTNQTTDASGYLTLQDALLIASTEYRVVPLFSDGSEGLDRYTAT